MTATQGPTLAGCTLTSKSELTLHFNKTLLGTEQLLVRPQTPQADWYHDVSSQHQAKLKTDSSVLMVCTVSAVDLEKPSSLDVGNATTCQCQTWHTLTLPSATTGDTTNQNTVTYCQEGPGWKPPPSMLAAAIKGRQPKPSNPYASQWIAVPLTVGGDSPAGTVSATADLALLKGRYPHAIRLAWPLGGTTVGHDDDMCCVSQAAGDGKAVCVPGNCPLYSATSELPANPFFASIASTGKCACLAPQACNT